MTYGQRRLLSTFIACLSSAAWTAACGTDPASEESAETTPALQHTGTTLAALDVSSGHQVVFAELSPGLSAVVEIGRMNETQPMLGGQLKEMSMIELYRQLAPEAEVPQSLRDAEYRSQSMPEMELVTGDSPALETGAGEGPRYYTDGEQIWFRNTFCNGAQNCPQGWDWANIVTSRTVGGNGSGVAMVGSEGTTNANLQLYYWECACVTPFCIGGPSCYWIFFWNGLVVPGFWMSVNINGTNHYIQYSLTGASGATVSLAARY